MILRLVEGYAPLWLAALLGAAVMAAVMASDSQILALSTMFTEDVFAFYGGAGAGSAKRCRCGPAALFVVVLTLVAYVIALQVPQSIFDMATQYAFAGYAALSPLLVAALFWRAARSGARSPARLWTAAAVALRRRGADDDAGAAARQPPCRADDLAASTSSRAPPPARWSLGLLPVVPMTLISALLMVVVSALTPRRQARTGRRWRSTSPDEAYGPHRDFDARRRR